MRANEILGQDLPLGIINSYIEKNKFFGGYIFSGPEGVGKKLVAQFIAQKLNCLSDAAGPCGSCPSCLKIKKSEHPDVHFLGSLDEAVKIDDIRNLQRQANLKPYEGKMKVFIIDNAHKLNLESANSLLKILEEAPPQSLIILITHQGQKILKTIVSRCKMIKFSPLGRGVLETVLVKNYALPKDFAHFLAFYTEGRLGLALRLKDSDIFAQQNRLFDAFVLSSRPLDPSLSGQTKENLQGFLSILASWFRDIYLLKAGVQAQEIIHSDRQNDLLKLTLKFSFKQLDEIMNTISESALYLENNINSKLILHNLGAQLWKA